MGQKKKSLGHFLLWLQSAVVNIHDSTWLPLLDASEEFHLSNAPWEIN